MGHIWIILSANFGSNRSRGTGLRAKTKMSVGGFIKSSSSKTNRTSRIKVSILGASGHAVSAPKIKLWRFRHFFSLFISFFLYLFKQISLCMQKLQNHQSYKLEIWRYNKPIYVVVHLHFWRRYTSLGLGPHPKLVIAFSEALHHLGWGRRTQNLW